MDAEQIKRIIELHKKWLNDEPNGKRANLHGADLIGANLSRANLCGADLSGADLIGADLIGADLIGANLIGANLSEAYLSEAYLSGANLRGADLSGADLIGADLIGANLSEAYLRGADLSGANIDYSCFPLWCGGLNVHIDDRQAIQLLYHLVQNVLFSKNTSAELKKLLGSKEIVDMANRFHRVDKCGKIAYYAEKTEVKEK